MSCGWDPLDTLIEHLIAHAALGVGRSHPWHRAFTPANQSDTVPDQYDLIVSDDYEVRAGATLELADGAELVIGFGSKEKWSRGFTPESGYDYLPSAYDLIAIDEFEIRAGGELELADGADLAVL